LTEDRNDFELELRRLPGVAGVGFSERDGMTVVHLLAPDTDRVEEIRRRAGQLGKRHVEGPVTIELDDGDGPVAPSAESRVRLLAVRRDRESGETEVHLAFGASRTVGRGPGDALKGAAEAAVEGLTKLGADIPYRIGEVVAIGQAGVQTVLVEMAPLRPGLDVRHGAADGPSIEEAAARATLHALNRWLAGPAGLKSEG
jgi:hypothetical protein